MDGNEQLRALLFKEKLERDLFKMKWKIKGLWFLVFTLNALVAGWSYGDGRISLALVMSLFAIFASNRAGDPFP